MKAHTLLSTRPDLIAQLHPTKNSHLDLTMIGLFSNKPATWVCPDCREEYPARVSNRSMLGTNCPYCDGKKVRVADSLAVKFPELVKQWHPTKNKGKLPTDYMPSSNKRAEWLCDVCGHEWRSIIQNRTRFGHKCPACAGKVATPTNNLAIKFPRFIKDWSPENKLNPYDYTPFSSKIVSWTCPKGHSWPARIADRTFNDQGCPICGFQDSKLQLFFYCELEYYYNVKYRHKINGLECDIFIPDYNIAVEVDGYYWHKDKNELDKKKAEVLTSLGITLINIREEGLKEISANAIKYKKHDDKFEVSKKLMVFLYTLIKDERLLEYSCLQEPINKVLYEKQVSSYPRQPSKTVKS